MKRVWKARIQNYRRRGRTRSTWDIVIAGLLAYGNNKCQEATELARNRRDRRP